MEVEIDNLNEDGASMSDKEDKGLKRKIVEEDQEDGLGVKKKKDCQKFTNEGEDDQVNIEEIHRGEEQIKKKKTVSQKQQQDMLHMIRNLKD